MKHLYWQDWLWIIGGIIFVIIMIIGISIIANTPPTNSTNTTLGAMPPLP